MRALSEITQNYEAAFEQLIGRKDERKTAVGFPVQAPVLASQIRDDAWKIDRPSFLPPLVAELLAEPVERQVFGDHGYDAYPTEYRLPAAITPEQRGAAAAALPVLHRSCAPMDQDSLAFELTRLRNDTACRKGQGSDDTGAIVSLAKDLKDYPADIVLEALRYWRRAEKWWPTLSELLLIIEPRCTRRRAVVTALEKASKSD